jgi:hypothetical protein
MVLLVSRFSCDTSLCPGHYPLCPGHHSPVELLLGFAIEAAGLEEIEVHLLLAPGELGNELWTEEWWFLEDVEGVAGLGAGVPLLHGERAVVL